MARGPPQQYAFNLHVLGRVLGEKHFVQNLILSDCVLKSEKLFHRVDGRFITKFDLTLCFSFVAGKGKTQSRRDWLLKLAHGVRENQYIFYTHWFLYFWYLNPLPFENNFCHREQNSFKALETLMCLGISREFCGVNSREANQFGRCAATVTVVVVDTNQPSRCVVRNPQGFLQGFSRRILFSYTWQCVVWTLKKLPQTKTQTHTLQRTRTHAEQRQHCERD